MSHDANTGAAGKSGVSLGRILQSPLALPLIGQMLLAPSANRRFLLRLLRQGYRAVRTRPGQVSHAEWLLGMQLPRHESRRASGEASRWR